MQKGFEARLKRLEARQPKQILPRSVWWRINHNGTGEWIRRVWLGNQLVMTDNSPPPTSTALRQGDQMVQHVIVERIIGRSD